MIDPAEFVSVARGLISDAAPSTDAHRRRAISTAYYALFHLVLNAGACRFVGDPVANRGAFALIYRGYSHADMAKACQEIAKPTLRQSVQIQLGYRSMSQAAREFAEDFVSI